MNITGLIFLSLSPKIRAIMDKLNKMTLYQKLVQLIHQIVANIGMDDFFTYKQNTYLHS